jgi:ribosome biogenesis GTPase
VAKHSPHKHTEKTLEGRIVASFGRRYEVELADDGALLECVTRGKKGGVACGDQVLVVPTSAGQAVIQEILPQKSLLYRSDAFKSKLIAANVSQILVVVAAVPSFYEDLVNRCLIAAETAGIRAVIVLNKADMVEESKAAVQQLALYHDLGYTMLALSAKQDVSPLLPYLQGQVSVLVGQSGMGKSSLINALVPEASAATREVSEALDSGRHTTTYARLYHLNTDSHIIDSPGLQEFGLAHLKPEEIDHAFIEFRPYLGKCRFNNCRHISEPGCAVLEAVSEGKISPRRLAVYQKMVGTHS